MIANLITPDILKNNLLVGYLVFGLNITIITALVYFLRDSAVEIVAKIVELIFELIFTILRIIGAILENIITLPHEIGMHVLSAIFSNYRTRRDLLRIIAKETHNEQLRIMINSRMDTARERISILNLEDRVLSFAQLPPYQPTPKRRWAWSNLKRKLI